MLAGRVYICDQVQLELLHSARDQNEFRGLRSNLRGVPRCVTGSEAWDRALEVYELLAGVSPQWHRSVKHPDLIIAATAELAGLPVIHYDQDFDAISEVTGQSVRWVAPRGSI